MKFFSVLSVTAIVSTMFISGCGSSSAPINLSVTPTTASLGMGQTTQFAAMVSDGSAVTWSASAGTIDQAGNYTAPSGAQSVTVTVTATSTRQKTRSASATVNVVAQGQVTATDNVQVALYSISPAATGKVSVQFGLDTNYALTTWTQPIPQGGGPVSLFVAGMKGNTLYHMRGVVQFSDGTQYMDPDMTFTTGAYPTAQMPAITVTTTAGMTPQSGVELLDLVNGGATVAPAVITDLQGNILWSYNPGITTTLNPVKLLPNGHIMVNFSQPVPDGGNSILQEVDLSGKLIWQLTAADLNTALAAATCTGCNITVNGTHHDVLMLPNGHLILLAATNQTSSGTLLEGDVLIDLDQNHKPVWLWNEFDPGHLDTSRHPMGGADWTHTNAVIYSPDDGNLIISIRHQNWLVKVDYNNGAGTGNILWKLGYQGDFTLAGGTDPTDWFYAQHGPSFATANTTGQFSLAVFDNGNDRTFPTGQVQCVTTFSASCYSTIQVLQLDETAKTATIAFTTRDTASGFSYFGGNAEVLKNGNVEYCVTNGAQVLEVTQDSSATTVWRIHAGMDPTGAFPFLYRGQRLPSMYPGVQW